MFKKLHLTPPPPYPALWFKFRPPINLRTPRPDNYCTVPYDFRFDSRQLKLNHKNGSCLKLTLSFTRFGCIVRQTAEDLLFKGFPTHSLLKYLEYCCRFHFSLRCRHQSYRLSRYRLLRVGHPFQCKYCVKHKLQ